MGQQNRLNDLAEKIRFQMVEKQLLPSQEAKPMPRRTPRTTRRPPAVAPAPRKVRRASPTNRTYEQRSAPPVMVRGNAGAPYPAHHPTRGKARRRYDVPLGMPGVEMQLPALPAIELSARTLAGVLMVALVALLVYFWNSPVYRLQDAQISGLQRLNSRDVNAALGLEDELIFGLDPRQIEATLLEAFPEFMSVTASIGLPNRLEIEVSERQPLLTWRQDGRTTLVDAAGFAFPLRDGSPVDTRITVDAIHAPPTLAAPDMENATIARFLQVEMVSAIVSMSAQAPADTPLLYDANHGLGWKDARGWDVYFGDVHDIDMKLNLYQAMVSQFEKEGTSPVLISVEYVHAPYYRLER